MEEPNGNYINFNYTDTLLTSLVNSAGQTISFTYNATAIRHRYRCYSRTHPYLYLYL